jgi:hypothetical protein
VDLFGNNPFVVVAGSDAAKAGVELGAELLAVDGLSFEAKLKEMRSCLPARSSERAFRRGACGRLLAGEPGSRVALELRSPDGRTGTFILERTDAPCKGAASAPSVSRRTAPAIVTSSGGRRSSNRLALGNTPARLPCWSMMSAAALPTCSPAISEAPSG